MAASFEELSNLTNEELCSALKEAGITHGAVGETTRKIYINRLMKHLGQDVSTLVDSNTPVASRRSDTSPKQLTPTRERGSPTNSSTRLYPDLSPSLKHRSGTARSPSEEENDLESDQEMHGEESFRVIRTTDSRAAQAGGFSFGRLFFWIILLSIIAVFVYYFAMNVEKLNAARSNQDEI
ncbi:unnamed protein product, partial [Mesorhabditis spiculigera]